MTQEDRISIHAPRAGSDGAHRTRRKRKRNFNPRSPCGERPSKGRTPTIFGSFQSTLPVRGATRAYFNIDEFRTFQSTLPVRGATRWDIGELPSDIISIHAPRAGSDHVRHRIWHPHNHFNPRSPCGERLLRQADLLIGILISIHAPRAGSDCFNTVLSLPPLNFNPRSPCGERPVALWAAATGQNFNPRSPCGERLSYGLIISPNWYFNPRSPCGERLRILL